MSKKAETAGAKYALDQIQGDYFQDWVGDQLLEASRMPEDTVVPLETKDDAQRIARKMFRQLEWDAQRDTRGDEIADIANIKNTREELLSFWKGFANALRKPETVDWLADELLERKPKRRGARETREGRSVRELPTGPLERDPYSKTALRADGLSLLPNRGEWIVSYQGEHMGSVKKLKSGWKLNGMYSGGRWEAALKRATELLDEYKSKSVVKEEILTRGDGTPIARPRRIDYSSDGEFGQAFYAYKDEISKAANSGFDSGFRSGLRRPKASRSAPRRR